MSVRGKLFVLDCIDQPHYRWGGVGHATSCHVMPRHATSLPTFVVDCIDRPQYRWAGVTHACHVTATSLPRHCLDRPQFRWGQVGRSK
jgi:hypothetical protein